ncbi:MAG: pilus assembly protein PilM [bacterium]
MIKELFLPERIGNRRIYAQRILAIDTQDDTVYAALVHAKRSCTVVEKLFKEVLEPGDEKTQSQRTIDAIKKIMPQVKRYDQVRISIPTAAVFKELVVPFIDTERIRMVLDYEIESMLPFSVDEASIDFIVTEKLPEQKSSHIFVAAVRNQDIQSILDITSQAGIEPQSITLDLFALYSLYQQIPEYQNTEQGSALIDVGVNVTQISFIYEGKLRLTRSIQKGLLTIVDHISKDTSVTEEEVLKKLKAIGIKSTGDLEYDRVVQKYMMQFFNDIQFTLNSFSLKLNYYKGVSKVLFAGKTAEVSDLAQFASDILQVHCEIFDPLKLFMNKLIQNKISGQIPNLSNYAIALGTAIPSPEQVEFDLRRKMFVLDRRPLIKKQLIAGFSFALILLSFIGVRGYLQLSKLSAYVSKIENNEIGRIIDNIPRAQRPKTKSLAAVIAQAEKILKEKQEVCAPFAQERVRCLDILFELTSIMDKKRFDIDISEIAIDEKIAGKPEVTVDGFLKSREGAEHFKAFFEFKKRFDDSRLLVRDDKEEEVHSAAEKGVQFTLKLTKKEE